MINHLYVLIKLRLIKFHFNSDKCNTSNRMLAEQNTQSNNDKVYDRIKVCFILIMIKSITFKILLIIAGVDKQCLNKIKHSSSPLIQVYLVCVEIC